MQVRLSAQQASHAKILHACAVDSGEGRWHYRKPPHNATAHELAGYSSLCSDGNLSFARQVFAGHKRGGSYFLNFLCSADVREQANTHEIFQKHKLPAKFASMSEAEYTSRMQNVIHARKARARDAASWGWKKSEACRSFPRFNAAGVASRLAGGRHLLLVGDSISFQHMVSRFCRRRLLHALPLHSAPCTHGQPCAVRTAGVALLPSGGPSRSDGHLGSDTDESHRRHADEPRRHP